MLRHERSSTIIMAHTLVAILTLATVLLPTARAVDSIADRNALTDLYHAMGGAQWKNNTNWLAPDISMCSWYGIVCGSCPWTSGASVECRVAELNLGTNGLIGPIAPAVQQLTTLTKLVLGGNALGGTIPSFSALSNLQWLDLNTAQLTGTIPEFEALDLKRLELYGNRLEGTLPTFVRSVRLEYLRLGPCYGLTGTIPSFSTLGQMQKLWLSGNQFTGNIPDFSALVLLWVLELGSNYLSGTVPAFAANARLQILNLYNNQLEGTVPAFNSLIQLQELGLDSNQLTGTVPAFTNLVNLSILALSDNFLTGIVPAFSTLGLLRSLYLGYNNFMGTVPEFAHSTQLVLLHLNNNSLTGTVPEFLNLTLLEDLNLNSNILTGTVPAFATHSKLQILDLHNNSLSGSIPSFSNMMLLRRLNLGINLLSGSLPFLASAPNLEVIRISRNRLTGNIPASWRALCNLTLVDVADNQLDGQVLLFQPSALPPLSAEFVNFSFNQFGGTFTELPPDDAINLTSMDIRGNQLLCPYPEFSFSLRIVRSECLNDWMQLGTYAGVAFGVGATGIALFYFIQRRISEQRMRAAVFGMAWIISSLSFLVDAYSYTPIVTYLQKQSQNCVFVNEFRVFYPQISTGDLLPPELRDVPDNFSFSTWIKSEWWQFTFNSRILRRLITDAFSSACRQAPECAYNEALAQCYNARPDLANNGGGAHQAFLAAVFTFIAIRAAYELFCLIVIVVSCARNSIILSCRVWIKGSIFLPLLLLRASTRAELFYGVIMADALPSEYVWELLTSGIVVTALILLAHTYYLLRVAQTGLTFSNWLSVVLGLVTLVRLVSQAAWSWRMLKKRALRERWYSSDFTASGGDFELDSMARGGLATGGDSGDNENVHDYVSM